MATAAKPQRTYKTLSVLPDSLRRAKLAAAHEEQTLVDFASDALNSRALSVLKKAGVPDPVS